MGWDFPWFNKSCIQLSRRSVDPIIYRFGVFYRSINMSCWILAYNNTETLSPGNLEKDSKESCLFQETSFDKRNRLKCCRDFFLLRISDHKFSTGRQASFSCVVGWGWKTHQKNNRTIVPATLYLRKASQYFTDTMITTYEATQQGSCFSWFRWRYLRLLHKT